MENKECTVCHEVKPLSEFYAQKRVTKKKGTYYQHKAECKNCTVRNYMKWREDNPERYEVTWNRYAQSEKRKNGKRAERKNRREELNQYSREWSNKNPAKVKQYQLNRLEKVKSLPNDFSKEDWQASLMFFGNSCAYCGTKDKSLQHEHFVPVSKNGEYTALNILPACKGCNASKYVFDFRDWYPRFEFYSEDRQRRIYEYFAYVKMNRQEAI